MWQVCSDSRIKPEIKRDIHNNAAVFTSSGIEDRPASGKSGSFMAALVTSWIRSRRRRSDPVSCLRKSKAMLYYTIFAPGVSASLAAKEGEKIGMSSLAPTT